ncbi:MAG: DUF1761 domain-containing protein [Terracidiphilus sp.]|nr:DUF1761 domain-containing protein [Terracidiphilus sp.]MDR3776850.1 DUF1761 domain-containing protein [Terracidiphilus sp.]
MVLLIWLVLSLVVVSFLLLLLAFWRRAIYERYSGGRPVACPADQQPAVVSIDVRHAAATVMDGRPDLRLSDCTRWPERSKCNQACLSQAIQAEPYKPGQVKAGRKQIYHLPVLLAAFAAWYVGAIWHSQYLFRERWTEALGLTFVQVKQTVSWSSVHLLTAASCLLFAYGVAWLLAVFHRKGVLQGVLMSGLLFGAVIATSWYGIARLPHDLFLIEAGYAVLATLTVGAIVGGLYDKLVLRSH